jgi:LPXTG-motif cell wall-anchored protein
VSSVASSPQLAFTGSNTLALASVGSSLTMLGLALVWVARRRPRRA